MKASDNWAKVGEAVKDRRVRQLHWTVKQATARADISDTTWGNLEKGDPVSDLTLISASEALGGPDVLQAVLDGADAVWPADPVEPDDAAGQLAAMRQELAELHGIVERLATRLLPPDR